MSPSWSPDWGPKKKVFQINKLPLTISSTSGLTWSTSQPAGKSGWCFFLCTSSQAHRFGSPQPKWSEPRARWPFGSPARRLQWSMPRSLQEKVNMSALRMHWHRENSFNAAVPAPNTTNNMFLKIAEWDLTKSSAALMGLVTWLRRKQKNST